MRFSIFVLAFSVYSFVWRLNEGEKLYSMRCERVRACGKTIFQLVYKQTNGYASVVQSRCFMLKMLFLMLQKGNAKHAVKVLCISSKIES